MKLDKYIKLAQEDVDFLNDVKNNVIDFSDWTNEELVEQFRILTSKVVVVKPAGEGN